VLLRQHAEEARSSQQVTQVDKEFFDSADVKTAEDIIRHVNATSKKGDERLIVLDEVQQIDHWERTVALRDIIGRHSIRDVPLLQDVARFAMDNIGQPRLREADRGLPRRSAPHGFRGHRPELPGVPQNPVR
jgi:predicted AAA+ superfamily ATPase